MPPMFKKTGSGWKKIQIALDPSKHNATVEAHVSRATMLNAKLAQAKIRQVIQSGSFAPNRPLTVALKGGSKPLTGTATAQLYNSVTTKRINATTSFAGVLRSAGVYSIARSIHDGISIKVTAKMRGLFYVLYLASQGRISPDSLQGRAKELWEQMSGGWFPLKSSTSAIIIPARPFVKKAFSDGQLRKQAIGNWKQALAAAYRELSR